MPYTLCPVPRSCSNAAAATGAAACPAGKGFSRQDLMPYIPTRAFCFPCRLTQNLLDTIKTDFERAYPHLAAAAPQPAAQQPPYSAPPSGYGAPLPHLHPSAWSTLSLTVNPTHKPCSKSHTVCHQRAHPRQCMLMSVSTSGSWLCPSLGGALRDNF